MKIPYYHVDVFTDRLFHGNPAGVCLLPDDWLPDDRMQRIAFENNLSETAFVTQRDEDYGLRWFTPCLEMDLCGHATVAPAHVLLRETRSTSGRIDFDTRSGIVSVEPADDMLVLDFPSRPPQPCPAPADVERVLGGRPAEALRARDYLFIFNSQDEILALQPDFDAMAEWDCLGVIVSAPGRDADFASRFFAPRAGVNEDPVTGSAHATLIPFWARRLGRSTLRAHQVSLRGGELFCRDTGARVKIGGHAVTYLRAEIDVPD